MKRLLYVVPGLNPSLKDGASNRVNSFVNCFHSHGYKVTVIALCHYNQMRKCLKNKEKFKNNGLCRWVVIPYTFFIEDRWKNLYAGFLKLLLFILTLLKKYDFILADYAIGGYLCKCAKRNSKLIVNHRGDLMDEYKMLHHEVLTKKAESNFLYYLNQSQKNADFSIFVSTKLKKRIEEQSGITCKVPFIFPCCADLKRFKDVDGHTDTDRIILGYFGGLSKWQNIEKVIEIAQLLHVRNSKYYLLILTNSDVSKYKGQLASLGTSNYGIHSVVFEQMPIWISKMDVSFVLRDYRPLNIVSSPTKISESLAAGVPIIATTASGDYKDVATDKTCLILDDLDINSQMIDKVDAFCSQIVHNRKEISALCKASVKDRSQQAYSDALIKSLIGK